MRLTGVSAARPARDLVGLGVATPRHAALSGAADRLQTASGAAGRHPETQAPEGTKGRTMDHRPDPAVSRCGSC